jgi:hypothetical protein
MYVLNSNEICVVTLARRSVVLILDAMPETMLEI